MRLLGEAGHRSEQCGQWRVREQGAGRGQRREQEGNGTEPTEPRRLVCAQSGMAQRTKQTARKSTGGAAPRRLLATEGAASRAAASHAVGSGGPKPWGRLLSPVEKIVAEAPPQVPVERGAVAELDGRWGAVVDVDPDAARMCWFDGSGSTTVKKDQLRAVKSAPATDWSGIGGTMSMAAAKREYLLKWRDGLQMPRTPVGSDDRGGSIVQVAEVLAAALQKHGGHTFVGLLAIKMEEDAQKEAWQRAEIERLRPGTAAGESLEGRFSPAKPKQ